MDIHELENEIKSLQANFDQLPAWVAQRYLTEYEEVTQKEKVSRSQKGALVNQAHFLIFCCEKIVRENQYLTEQKNMDNSKCSSMGSRIVRAYF